MFNCGELLLSVNCEFWVENGGFNERSDRFNNIDEEQCSSIHKNSNLIVRNGKTGDTSDHRSKPFVPPKQVLMYLVR